MTTPQVHARTEMSPARIWLLAARPATLPAAIVPVLVGTALAAAEGTFRPAPFLAALVASLLIQVGTNLANDLFDFQKGADTAERLGPTRVTQSGLVTPATVRNAMVATFTAAALIGVYLIAVGGWPILVVGVLSIISAVAYTGGPWPLGYHGLGEVFVFLFFGVVAVAGSYYLQAGTVSAVALAASIPVGLLCTAIIIVNNVRDIDTDRRAGKRTLAVRIGRTATRALYTACVAVSYAVPVAFWLAGVRGLVALLPLISIPLAVPLVRTVWTATSGPPLNGVLKGTGRLHLVFGLLFAVSLLIR
ncbi:MAG TPA: 1,4-dihydroxy-2-naphthoate polyprenyltransferase [Chloroflexia bacterium]|nr:1,4-dihydroxy-2-naphthoate polyprenyltransferase [Chloroflexia bacterium]